MKTMMVGCVVVVLVFLGGCSRDPNATISGSQMANPVAPSEVAASRALRDQRELALRATVADRLGDGVQSDYFTSGTRVYGGHTHEVFILDATLDIVRFKSAEAGRYLRLVVPEADVDARCDDFYKLNQQPASGTNLDIANLPIGSTREDLEGYLECLTGSVSDYYVKWGNCTLLEHAAAGVWVARAEATCTARLDVITRQRKSTVLGYFSIPWRWDGVEIP